MVPYIGARPCPEHARAPLLPDGKGLVRSTPKWQARQPSSARPVETGKYDQAVADQTAWGG